MWAMALALVCAVGASARAGGLALESVAGERDQAQSAMLRPLFEELARLGYAGVASRLAAALAAKRARPSRAGGLPADYLAQIERAYEAYLGGDFAAAKAALEPLVALARNNAAEIAGNGKLAPGLLKAHVGLAMAHQRLGASAAAAEVMAEIVRSFEAEVTKGQFGSEAYALYQQAKKQAKAAAKGTLSVRVADPATVVYVNERFAKTGELLGAELAAGTYRVMAQLGPRFGRVVEIVLAPGAAVELALDPATEAAIVLGPAFAGLGFRDREEREADERAVAQAVGRELGEAGVVVAGIDQRKGKLVAYAALVNATTGNQVRRASVVVESLPPPARLHALARFVVSGGEPSDGVEAHRAARPEASVATEVPARPIWSPRRKLAVGLVAVGIAAVAGGVILAGQADSFEDDAFKLCPNPEAGCVESDKADSLLERAQDRSLYSGISYGAAGVAVLGAGLLWWFGAPAEEDSVARLRPKLAPDGGYAGLELFGRF